MLTSAIRKCSAEALMCVLVLSEGRQALTRSSRSLFPALDLCRADQNSKVSESLQKKCNCLGLVYVEAAT